MATKNARVIRDFKDAGTERSFTAGKTVELTDGEFTNYAAAGLVEVAPTETKADIKKA